MPQRQIIVRSGSLTRPADTTAYAANDLVGISTSVVAGNSPEIADVVAQPLEAFRFDRVRIRKSNKSLTNASFRVHFYRAQPTWDVADNADAGAISALKVTDLASHVGYVDITMDRASNTAGAYGVANPSTGAITVQPDSGTSIYFAIQATAAYTPASAEVFTVDIEGIRS